MDYLKNLKEIIELLKIRMEMSKMEANADTRWLSEEQLKSFKNCSENDTSVSSVSDCKKR